jgi:hypothetical protein
MIDETPCAKCGGSVLKIRDQFNPTSPPYVSPCRCEDGSVWPLVTMCAASVLICCILAFTPPGHRALAWLDRKLDIEFQPAPQPVADNGWRWPAKGVKK